ncbi:MAG: hypothetical protein A2521_16005 [Deltaproteobacteria bacterium RIFOXYD12_FULL_57_12]|nr:MAG: hypothetical protein A2521_16005 [Deltaproteobacteria bacterium RIFOXYD12_FULL_57_12]
MNDDRTIVEKRDIVFASRTVTKIWEEVPSPANPYLADCCRCHGYDILELAASRSFPETIFLLFQGELPTRPQAELFETLMVGLINPGPRHPATRAAMNAGVGKTSPVHILPIGLTVLGGSVNGGEEVEAAMRFIRKNSANDPAVLVAELMDSAGESGDGDLHVAPGFGSHFGGIDPMPAGLADLLLGLPGSGNALAWGSDVARLLADHNQGWRTTGIAAAVFCDLGFLPRVGIGLFQLLCAPGLLAHGMELYPKPIHAMPFLDKEHYVIAEEARTRKR